MLEFKVNGLDQLHRELQEIPVRVERNILRGMVRAAAKPVVEDARARAPRLKDEDPRRVPGALAASVRAMSSAAKGALVKGGVIAGSARRTMGSAADAFYASFVEYGTRKMRAFPFLRPAADARSPDAIAAAAAYVRTRLDAGDLRK